MSSLITNHTCNPSYALDVYIFRVQISAISVPSHQPPTHIMRPLVQVVRAANRLAAAERGVRAVNSASGRRAPVLYRRVLG